MITNDDKRSDGVKNWHYLAVKSLSRLLKGITSNHVGDFYCLNCFHSYTTKNKLEKHEKISKDHDFCNVKMPEEDNKILKYNPGEKSLKVPFIIYADLECLLEKIDTCKNNPEKSYTEKKLNINLQVTRGSHVVHLINQKLNGIITEEKTAWKSFAKI